MAKSEKMTERELAAHLESEISSSLGYLDGKLTTQRSDALDRYYGKKYGNEQEGRSQIVTRDVADVIEWIMPSLMKIFTGGDKVVKFEPQGPEDVEMAKQSTDYVNYVIMRQTPGFSIIYQWTRIISSYFSCIYWFSWNSRQPLYSYNLWGRLSLR